MSTHRIDQASALEGDTDRSAGRRGFLRKAAAGVVLAAGGLAVTGRERATNAVQTMAAVFGDSISGSGAWGLRILNSSTAASTSGLRAEMTATTQGASSAAVRGINRGTNANGIGVIGTHAGGGWGVYGQSASGRGVYGKATGGYGVFGESSTGTGVHGRQTAVTGTQPGVSGQSNSTAAGANAVLGTITSTAAGSSSAGVRGINNSTSASGIGVYGSQAGSGYGVYGTATNGSGVVGSGGYNGVYASGGSYGVQAFGTSSSGYGIYTRGGSSGVYASGGTNGVQAYGSSNGVYASATSYGVQAYAASGSGTGVYGSGYYGLYGYSSSANGVYGNGYSYGVLGAGNTAGVHGSSSQVALWGEGGKWGLFARGSDYGVHAISTSNTGWAGWFAGNVNVTGNLSKAGGSFKIDHPVDPANKYLSHSFVESPDMMNVYNGVVELDAAGKATVTLPSYFQALNKEFRYQLTPIGAASPNLHVAAEVQANKFRIAGGKPGTKVSWQVTGVRQDAWANAHRIEVETEKEGVEKGKYLTPKEHGRPESQAIGAVPAAKREHQAPKAGLPTPTSPEDLKPGPALEPRRPQAE